MARAWRRMGRAALAMMLALAMLAGAPALSGAAALFTAKAEPADSWAIYMYVCGTDLESKTGAATADLVEVIRQALPKGVTVVIETGGARRWRNRLVSAKNLDRFVYQGDQLYHVWRGALASMGDSGTLADFLRYCRTNYPAAHEALILWDHGGGSAGGLVMDELFDRDRLSLTELREAFEKALTPNLKNPPLDIVGFDACLMATVDTAAVLKGVARYMVASEETEPGCGWNYQGIVNALRGNPRMDGASLGKAICDTYMMGCAELGVVREATLSVVDLGKIQPLLDAYEGFGTAAIRAACENAGFFAEFGRGAKLAENYGGNTPSSGYANMVDLGDLADQTKALLPRAARGVLDALEECVIYKVNGTYRAQASGLSCFYAYDGSSAAYDQYARAGASESFKAFYDYMLNGTLDAGTQEFLLSDLGFEEGEIEPLETLNDFEAAHYHVHLDEEGYAVLTMDAQTLASAAEISFLLAYVDDEDDLLLFLGSDNDIDQDWENGVFKDNFRGVWGAIDGCLCHMEIAYQGDDYNLYNIPILLNGEAYQLKVIYDYDYESYYILGAQRGLDDQGMADRAMVRLRVGDVITTLHYAASASGEDKFELVEIEDLVVRRNTRFEEVDLGDGEFLMMFAMTDARGETAYSEEISFTVEGDDITIELA